MAVAIYVSENAGAAHRWAKRYAEKRGYYKTAQTESHDAEKIGGTGLVIVKRENVRLQTDKDGTTLAPGVYRHATLYKVQVIHAEKQQTA